MATDGRPCLLERTHDALDLRAIHLFTGGGGGILGGLLVGHIPVCAVELDPYCQRVLIARQQDGSLPPFPIWDDVCTFDGTAWRGRVEVVHAGFPCQPFSTAGKRQGEHDPRNLWPDTYRILCEVRPRYVFLENVPALLAQPYFGTILGGLAEARYDTRWCVLGADDVGANHRRKRLWILAHDDGGGQLEQYGLQGVGRPETPSQCLCGDVAHAQGHRMEEQPISAERPVSVGHVERGGAAVPYTHQQHDDLGRSRAGTDGGKWGLTPGLRHLLPERAGWWDVEPPLGRVAHGIPDRVHQLRALGNAQVPLCVATAWHLLTATREES